MIVLEPEGWAEHHGDLYRCAVHLTPSEDGGFAATTARLPGVASQGETEAEALANITESLAGVISAYRDEGRPVPWTEHRPPPARGSRLRWVFVRLLRSTPPPKPDIMDAGDGTHP